MSEKVELVARLRHAPLLIPLEGYDVDGEEYLAMSKTDLGTLLQSRTQAANVLDRIAELAAAVQASEWEECIAEIRRELSAQ